MKADQSRDDVDSVRPPVPRFWPVVLAVSLLALLVRSYRLLDSALWEDEGWTLRLVLAGDGRPLSVLGASIADFWPPLHYVLLNAVGHIVPVDVLSMRLVSVFSGAAACGALAFAAARLTSSLPTALLAGSLLAVNIPHVLHSQEARVYPLMTLLAVLSNYALVEGLRGRPLPKLYVAATVGLLYSHIFAVFLFLPQVGIAFIAAIPKRVLGRTNRAIPIVIHQCVVAAIWLPLILAMVLESRANRVPKEWATGDSAIGAEAWLTLLASLSVRTLAGAAVWLLLLAALFLLLAKRLRSRPAKISELVREPIIQATLLGTAWVGGVLTTSALMTALAGVDAFGAQRYHLIAAPGLCLLASLGLLLVRGDTGRWVLAVAAPLVAGGIELPRHFARFQRAEIDKVAAHARLERADQAFIVGNYFRTFNHYLRGPIPRIGGHQWETWVAQFPSDTAFTVDGTKLEASTYYSEKLDPRIVSVFGRGFGKDWATVALERARTAVDTGHGSFMIIGNPTSERDGFLFDSFVADKARCPIPRVLEWRQVRVLECKRSGFPE
jgi:hypothetical protein